jgi:hypothetical protein
MMIAFMLGGVIQSGVMLSRVMPSGVMMSGVTLSGVILRVKCIIWLNVVTQRVNQGLKKFFKNKNIKIWPSLFREGADGVEHKPLLRRRFWPLLSFYRRPKFRRAGFSVGYEIGRNERFRRIIL